MLKNDVSKNIFKLLIIGVMVIVLQFIFTINYNVLAIEEENEQEQVALVDIGLAEIGEIPNYTYTGSEIKPNIEIVYNNQNLVLGTDYIVTYQNNINAGTATVIIEGIAPCYNGIVYKDFTIYKKSLSTVQCNLSASKMSYTGQDVKVGVYLYNGSLQMINGIDYEVTYSNTKNIGIASVIITSKGNYTGTIIKDYYITPKNNKIKSVTFNSKFTKATIKWSKDKTVTGYAIYMSEAKDGEYKCIKKIKDNETTKYIKGGLNPKKEYYFKIRAYKTVNDKTGKEINIYSKDYSAPATNLELLAEVKLTSKSSGANRNHNLQLASKKINGLVLKPGQSFNWFKVVGPASKKNGYKEAIIFLDGKSVPGYGGGVCQVSTTLYQTALKAKLKIQERHSHSKAVSYTTRDKDATVAYGSSNFRFKNNKSYSIKIVTSSKGGSTYCKMYKVNN